MPHPFVWTPLFHAPPPCMNTTARHHQYVHLVKTNYTTNYTISNETGHCMRCDGVNIHTRESCLLYPGYILSWNLYDYVWATLSPQRFVLRICYNDGSYEMLASCRTWSKHNHYSQPSTLLSPASLVNSHTRVVIGILLCIAERYANWYPQLNSFATSRCENEKSPKLVQISRVLRRCVPAS